MEKEIRKDVSGYEGRYQVSNLGRVLCLHPKGAKEPKVMKWERNSSGYPRVKFYSGDGFISRKTYQVHRLVYLTFNNLPIEYQKNVQVLHKDDNPENTRLDNLFQGTIKDNVQDCIRKGRFKYIKDVYGGPVWNKGKKMPIDILNKQIESRKKGFMVECELAHKLFEELGTVIKVANKLGMSRAGVYNRLEKYDLFFNL